MDFCSFFAHFNYLYEIYSAGILEIKGFFILFFAVFWENKILSLAKILKMF